MFIRFCLLTLLITLLIACSASRTNEGIYSTDGIELVDNDEDLLEIDERTLTQVRTDVAGSNVDTLALKDLDNQQVDFVETQPINSRVSPEPFSVGAGGVIISPDEDFSYSNNPPMRTSGSTGNYKVKKSETLMLIAFKLYGDYSRWRELKHLNRHKIKGHTVYAGSTIQYYTEGAGFSWNPKGEPYLIKRRDTLGKISNKVYGSFKHWKTLWKNNRPLIKNPNKIFAGFTIYYPVDLLGEN